MSKPVIFLDMDGCIASQGKLWSDHSPLSPGEIGVTRGPFRRNLSVQKIISDHDSWAVDTFKNQADIIIISGDERINRAWAERRGVPFIFTCAKGFHQDKWEHLKRYWSENIRNDIGPSGDYYYLGDCMPDKICMLNAIQAFYPNDAAFCIKERTYIKQNLKQLESKSGQGCFEEMCWHLVQDGVLTYE